MTGDGHRYALVPAGGRGLRFWPVSRRRRPKQLLDIFGSGSCLLGAAVRRARRVVGDAGGVIVLTSEELRADVEKVVDAEGVNARVVTEPMKRDTGPAVAFGVGVIGREDAEGRMVVLPSDAVIGDEDAFVRVVSGALDAAGGCDAPLATVGVRPTWGCPSYGYIERGETVAGRMGCYKVKRFREKPDAETAAKYVASGKFYWNAGMFVWSVPAVLREMDAVCPDLSEFARGVMNATDVRQYVRERYAGLRARSIDYALMEGARDVVMYEASFAWDDVGSWIAVGERLQHDAAGNAGNVPLVTVNARENIVYGCEGKQVALLGVNGLVVVETEDALLVTRREDVERIREVTAKLPEELL